MPSLESILRKVFVAVVVAAVVVVAYLLIVGSAPVPAIVTPSSTAIDVGQQVFVAVQWKGGSAPYAVDLYSVPSGPCNSTATLVGEKTGLTQPQYIFTISPSTTAHYCGQVSTTSSSSAISASALITVNPVLGNPSLAFTPPAIDSGQTGTVIATVNIVGGSPPYTVTLYSGTDNSCAKDTTAVGVTNGKNPITQLVGTQARFSVIAPSAATYYCATLKDNTPATPTTSAAVKFNINNPLTATISPASPKLDSGQSLTLSANAAQGTPPYTYQWSTGDSCSTMITGQNSSTYSTGTLTSTSKFSVSVGDSSTGSPAANVCAKATVTYGSQFTGSVVSIGPSVTLDSGQSTTLTVSWPSAGNLPYTVRLLTSPSAACTGTSPVSGLNNMTKITSTSIPFTVSPTVSTFYCAMVSDSATSQESSTTSTAATITVNPALSVAVNLNPTAIDSGQSTTVQATVSISGGTSPYTVTLFGGSSSNCAADTSPVSTNGPNPQVGLPGPTASFAFSSPGSTTYFCASVVDRATTPNTVESSPAQFTVNPSLSAAINPPNPAIVAGNSLTLTAVPTGGTSPYTYQWYNGAGCASGGATSISGQTSATYSTGVLSTPDTKTSTYKYSVLVTDSNVGKTALSSCASVTVTVTPALTPVLSLSPSGIDQGQTTTVTATVTWTGGTAPYTVTLLSGTTATTCTTQVIVLAQSVNPKTGVTKTNATFAFNSPQASTYYCATVKDSASTPATISTAAVQFMVNPPISKVTVAVSPAALDAGQSTTVSATVTWTGGTAPYVVTLNSGSNANCLSDTVRVPISSNPKSGVAGNSVTFSFNSPGSSTYYCAVVTDSGVPPVLLSSNAPLFTVSAVLAVGSPAISPTTIDSGQSTSVTATVTWSGGTQPFTVTMFSGSSTSCSSDTTILGVLSASNPVTGVTGTTASFTFASPAASTYYCASVKDTSSIPVTVLSGTAQFNVNPALSANLAPLSPPALDSGQSTTVTATISWSGGTPPYSASLFSGLSPNCQADTTPAGTPKGSLITTSTTITFSSASSTTYYCAKVTDSSAVPFTYTSASTRFNVNSPPAAAVTPPAPSIGSGQTGPTLTAVASGGTSPYSYQWYTGSTCASAIVGQTLPTYMPGVLSVTSTYSVKITDSSTGTPTAASTTCATVTVTVGSGPEGVASNRVTGFVYVADPLANHISVIDSFSNTVVTTISVGTLPWGIAVDTVNDIIYVTNYGSGTVSIIDGKTNGLCAPPRCPSNTITVGSNPEGIALNLPIHQAYVANSGSNTLTVINMTGDNVLSTVAVGSSPQNIAIGPAPPRSPPNTPPYTVFVTNYGSNTISVIPVTSPYLSFPVTTVTVGNNPWGVAVDPATNKVYVTNSGSGTISVLNGSSWATITTVNMGATPEGIDINSPASTAYITNPASNTVAVLNLLTNTFVSSSSPPVPVPVGNSPWGVSLLTPSTNASFPNLAYVTNSGMNTVSVIDLSKNQVIATIIVS